MTPILSFRFAGYTYQVYEDAKNLRSINMLGRASEDVREIVLTAAYGSSQLRETLWHELLHTISLVQLGRDEDSGGLSEATVNVVARNIFAVLEDNPMLLRFLQGVGVGVELAYDCGCRGVVPCNAPLHITCPKHGKPLAKKGDTPLPDTTLTLGPFGTERGPWAPPEDSSSTGEKES